MVREFCIWVCFGEINTVFINNGHVCVQLCLTLCDSMDFSSPGSSVHGISQARILEWLPTSFCRVYSQPRDRTVSCTSYIMRKCDFCRDLWKAPEESEEDGYSASCRAQMWNTTLVFCLFFQQPEDSSYQEAAMSLKVIILRGEPNLIYLGSKFSFSNFQK